MTKQEFMLTLKIPTRKLRQPKKRTEDNVTEVPKESQQYLNGGFTDAGEHAFHICQWVRYS